MCLDYNIRLQNFKTNVANSVVNESNSTLKSMNTSQLLDLFTYKKEAEEQNDKTDNKKKKYSGNNNNNENAELRTADSFVDELGNPILPSSSLIEDEEDHQQKKKYKKRKAKDTSRSAVLDNLANLWDDSQYTEEYNLNQFLTKLRDDSSWIDLSSNNNTCKEEKHVIFSFVC